MSVHFGIKTSGTRRSEQGVNISQEWISVNNSQEWISVNNSQEWISVNLNSGDDLRTAEKVPLKQGEARIPASMEKPQVLYFFGEQRTMMLANLPTTASNRPGSTPRTSTLTMSRESKADRRQPLPSSWPGRRDRRTISRSSSTKNQYDLSRHVDVIRPEYAFDISLQGTVPQAIRAFYDSTDFEDAIRTAVSLGGDCDTLPCITGGIAQAFYGGVPVDIQSRIYAILDMKLGDVARKFMERFCGLP
ncbi:ADP-ribosylglycohydrolase family protein [Desulfonatronum sp. SC1]|uniref:ADP-ribosylglycohydrolase family protein n=1 Tax=Desulfonatronum sp. SC1 TaxID=2109626 RepID=UPI001E602E9E|nr:ADP-ribosylglycohydrolase family protein [Desulfonatronum sp. SC1]